MDISICVNDEEIAKCYPVMSQLRADYDKENFVKTIKRLQKTQNYILVMLRDDGVVCAVLGLRIGESLAWGKYAYIDDLVTDSNVRSAGYGNKLMDWAKVYTQELNCSELHLDSGVQRHGAHRFYLREYMDIVFYHFKWTAK